MSALFLNDALRYIAEHQALKTRDPFADMTALNRQSDSQASLKDVARTIPTSPLFCSCVAIDVQHELHKQELGKIKHSIPLAASSEITTDSAKCTNVPLYKTTK